MDTPQPSANWAKRAARHIVPALVSGIALALAFEPVAFAWILPVAVAGFVLTTYKQRMRVAFAAGIAFGIGFQFALISWTSVISLTAWLALGTVETLFYGLLAVIVVALARLRWWPLWFAVAWTAMEAIRATWPLSGMPMGRLSFAIIDTPAVHALPYIGSFGVTLLLALVGSLLAWTVLSTGKKRVMAISALALVIASFALPTFFNYAPHTSGSATVASIQGNVPGNGHHVRDNYRQVTQNHVDATVSLGIDVKGGNVPKPTFVLWPENSTAVDPFKDKQTNSAIQSALNAVKAPILVGAIVENDASSIYNQGIVWNPSTGPADRYAKHHPVPFGEYIPFRQYIKGNFGKLSPVTRDMLPGTSVDPITIGGVKVANTICFDIDYDGTIYQQISHGAQMITVQSSNALFVDTQELDQQFAITRLRAIETGRSVAVATTNGISGIIGPYGNVIAKTAPRTQAVLLEKVSLSTSITPAVRIGNWIGTLCLLITAAGLIASIVTRLRKPQTHNNYVINVVKRQGK